MILPALLQSGKNTSREVLISASRPGSMRAAKSCAYEQILLVAEGSRRHGSRAPEWHHARTAGCDGIRRSCCVVDTSCETHTVHVRLMTFLLPDPESDGQIARESPLEEADAAL